VHGHVCVYVHKNNAKDISAKNCRVGKFVIKTGLKVKICLLMNYHTEMWVSADECLKSQHPFRSGGLVLQHLLTVLP